MNNKLQSFYYTFGTTDSQPYQRGWVEVQAQNRSQADTLFRSRYPDREEGHLNCSSVYDQETFPHILDHFYSGSPDWTVCHDVISLRTRPQDRTPDEIYEFLQETQRSKDLATVNLGITMYHIASHLKLEKPLTTEELNNLAVKIHDCWLTGTRTTDDVEYAVWHMLEEGTTHIGYYENGATHHTTYSPEAVRQVLLSCDRDIFHFLVNTELGHQATIDLRSQDGSDTILGQAIQALDSAEREVTSEKGIPPLADAIRNAEDRTHFITEPCDNNQHSTTYFKTTEQIR